MSFVNSVTKRLQNKLIEVHTGDTRKTHYYSEQSFNEKSVIRGILKEALDDCLIIEVSDIKTNEAYLIYLNCWNIIAITEVKNNFGLANMYSDIGGGK
jgi:hypothetical protein